jgi:small subunit ribosomal protein S20
MPNHISSKKRVRQDIKRQAYNRFYKVMVKRAMKDVIASTDANEAEQKYRRAAQVLDRVADKDIIHRNYAANHKSKLAAHVNALKKA